MRPGKRLLIPCLLLIVAGLGAGWFFRQPLQQRLTDWQVENNMASFREAGDAGDWALAYRHALSAHQLNPRQLDSLMALLRAGNEGQTGGVLDVAMRVLHHPDASVAEKAQALKMFLKTGDGVLFHRCYQQLPEADQQQPEMKRVYARYLAQKGRLGEAAAIYDRLAKTDPDPELIQSLAAVLARAAGKDVEAGTRAQKLIVELLQDPDRNRGLRALRLLQGIPWVQWQVEDVLGAATWVEQHSDATTPDRLLVAAMRIRSDESQRERVIDEAVSRFAADEPELVARWLGVLLEYDLALEVLDAETAASSPDAFMARALLLHRGGRSAEAAAWLETPHRGIRPSVVSALRAVLAPPEQAARFWEKALQAAELEESASAFWRISKSAASAGNRSVEMRAAVEALKRPGAHPPVAELSQVLVWLYRNDHAEDLLAVSRKLIQRQPESPVLRNNLAYLEVVSGRLTDRGVAALEDLQQEFPSVSQFATSRAVACLARGEYRIAREILESAIADWDDAGAPALAAYAVALKGTNDGAGAAGQVPPGESIRQRVKWDEMLSVEQEFFRSRLDAAELSAAGAGTDADSDADLVR